MYFIFDMRQQFIEINNNKKEKKKLKINQFFTCEIERKTKYLSNEELI